MSQHIPEPDPRSRFEDEGIPDLQDGSPEQERAVDPQEAPVPADQPMAIDDFGTTADEQAAGAPLDDRLGREVGEEQPMFGAGPAPARDQEPETGTVGAAEDRVTADSGLGAGADLSTDFEPGPGADHGSPAQPEEPSGQIWEDPRPAGRLVAPDEGAHADDEPDEVAAEAGPDRGGYPAEEAAMRVEPE